jgi:hypothetical protein
LKERTLERTAKKGKETKNEGKMDKKKDGKE